MLKVDHLRVTLDKRLTLHNTSFVVPSGTTWAVTGPSGSGKTTLLRAIAGLIRIDTGTIYVDGVDVTHLPTHKRNIGLMFQDGQLFPTMTVAENIEFGLRMRNVASSVRADRVNELLSLVQLDGFNTRDVSTLSGGQARRVALARSLAPEPPVLLLDEPLTGLEEDLRYELAEDLARIISSASLTTVVVTHDKTEAGILAPTVVDIRELDTIDD